MLCAHVLRQSDCRRSCWEPSGETVVEALEIPVQDDSRGPWAVNTNGHLQFGKRPFEELVLGHCERSGTNKDGCDERTVGDVTRKLYPAEYLGGN